MTAESYFLRKEGAALGLSFKALYRSHHWGEALAVRAVSDRLVYFYLPGSSPYPHLRKLKGEL